MGTATSFILPSDATALALNARTALLLTFPSAAIALSLNVLPHRRWPLPPPPRHSCVLFLVRTAVFCTSQRASLKHIDLRLSLQKIFASLVRLATSYFTVLNSCYTKNNTAITDVFAIADFKLHSFATILNTTEAAAKIIAG